MAERVVWKTDIERDDITAVIRKLSTLSNANIVNINRLLAKLEILDEVGQSLRDDPKNLAKDLVPTFQELAQNTHPDYELAPKENEDFVQERLHDLLSSESEVHPILPEPEKSAVDGPKTMKIQRDSFSVRNSYHILVNTAEWLIKRGKLRKENYPIVAGHKRYLVHTEPKHRYGEDFRAQRKLSNGSFIETHYSTARCIANARKLLEGFGFDGSMLEVE